MKKKVLLLTISCLLCISPWIHAEGVLLRQADKYRTQGRYLEALSFYRDICMNNWQNKSPFTVYKGMADIYYMYLDNIDKAIELYNLALKDLPHSVDAAPVYHNLAKLYYKKGQHELSKKLYRQLFSMFPDYFRKHDIDAEIRICEQNRELPEDKLLSVTSEMPGYVRVLVADGVDDIVVSSEGTINFSDNNSMFFKKTEAGVETQILPGQLSFLSVGGREFSGPV